MNRKAKPIVIFRFMPLLIFFLCMLFFIQCKKDESPNPAPAPAPANPNPPSKPTRYFPVKDELKAWCLFQPGSYWVYLVDTVLPAIDCVYVSSVSTSTILAPYKPDTLAVEERITLRFEHTYKYAHLYSYWVLTSHTQDRLYAPRNDVSIFKLDSTLVSTVPGEGFYLNQSVSNFQMNNVIYGNVRYIGYNYTIKYKYNMDVFPYLGFVYWKRNVGLIKYSNNFETFSYPYSLLRYQVIQ